MTLALLFNVMLIYPVIFQTELFATNGKRQCSFFEESEKVSSDLLSLFYEIPELEMFFK